MKRSNFLASIAAIFLAPFGIKAKPKEFSREWGPELIFDKEELEYTRFTAEPLTGPNVSIPYPPIPDDGKKHDIWVKYDNGKIEYFIDGKEV